MKMWKDKFVFVTVILSGLLMVFSCNQDPIFFKISHETLPEKPRVQGGPTNIVEFERNGTFIMYVASGSLHWYTGASGWDSPGYYIPPLSGRVIGLAATMDHLYALCISEPGVIATLWRIGHTETFWTNIPIIDSTYILIQTIYADPDTDRLFAGARNNKGNDYGILVCDPTPPASLPFLRLLQGNTEMLTGAASDTSGNYYLSTGFPDTGKKGGVYKVDSALSSITHLGGGNLMGMIKLKDPAKTIIVIERENGMLYMVTVTGVFPLGLAAAINKWTTGAMAIWENVVNPAEKMLIVGIQGGLYSTSSSSSFKHGYVEFYLTAAGALDPTRPRNDPPTITVANSDQYQGSLGKHPINFMHQTSTAVDPNRLFFVSTQAAGLWSYKRRSDGLQWNAED